MMPARRHVLRGYVCADKHVGPPTHRTAVVVATQYRSFADSPEEETFVTIVDLDSILIAASLKKMLSSPGPYQVLLSAKDKLPPLPNGKRAIRVFEIHKLEPRRPCKNSVPSRTVEPYDSAENRT